MMPQIQLQFRGAQLFVIREQNRPIEAVLVAEIIVKHALAGVGARRDPVDPRARQPPLGEFRGGDLDDIGPRLGRVLRPYSLLALTRRHYALQRSAPGRSLPERPLE